MEFLCIDVLFHRRPEMCIHNCSSMKIRNNFKNLYDIFGAFIVDEWSKMMIYRCIQLWMHLPLTSESVGTKCINGQKENIIHRVDRWWHFNFHKFLNENYFHYIEPWNLQLNFVSTFCGDRVLLHYDNRNEWKIKFLFAVKLIKWILCIFFSRHEKQQCERVNISKQNK